MSLEYDTRAPPLFSRPSDNKIIGKTYFVQEEKKDSDTVITGMSGSVLDGASSIDDSTGVAEMRRRKRASDDDNIRSTRSRSRSKRKSRRKRRGTSLERLVSQMILSTATSGATESHFEVFPEQSAPDDKATSVDSILQDLTLLDEEMTVTERSSKRVQGLSRPGGERRLQDESDSHLPNAFPPLDQDLSQDYADPPLEMNFSDVDDDNLPPKEEQGVPVLTLHDVRQGQTHGTGVEPVDSFESMPWKEVQMDHLQVNPSRSLSPALSTLSPPALSQMGSKQDPPADASVDSVDEYFEGRESAPTQRASFRSENPPPTPNAKAERHQAQGKAAVPIEKSPSEKVIFKTNFDDWTPFKPAEFSFNDARFSDTLLDPLEFEESNWTDGNGFLVKPTPKIPRLRAPPRQLLDSSRPRRSMDRRPPSALQGRRSFHVGTSFHPNSPDSVFDYPGEFSFGGGGRSTRSDPPATRDLQFPEDRRSRIAI